MSIQPLMVAEWAEMFWAKGENQDVAPPSRSHCHFTWGKKKITRFFWKSGSEALEIDFILRANIKKDIPEGIVLVKKPTFHVHSPSQSLRVLL